MQHADVAALTDLITARFGEGSSEWWALERGLASERPLRDGLTHVWAPLALRRGHLLPRRGVGSRCTVHAVAVDVRGLIQMNDHHGFAPTDAALRRIARSLTARFPDRVVVRVHGDAFAAILSEESVQSSQPSLGAEALRALEAELVDALRGPERLTSVPDRVTCVEIDLELGLPHDAELLGTLTHAEIEAALRDRSSRRRIYDFT